MCLGNDITGLVLFDYHSKQFIYSSSKQIKAISCFAFNNKCTLLAVADLSGSLIVFDLQSFFPIATFNDSYATLTSLKFMTDQVLLSSSLDGKARAYDMNKGKKFREMTAPDNNQLMKMDAEENGEMIFASGMDPYDIYVWSLQTGGLVDVLSLHTGPVHLLTYARIS